jgi:hypothetical protein
LGAVFLRLKIKCKQLFPHNEKALGFVYESKGNGVICAHLSKHGTVRQSNLYATGILRCGF